MGAVAGSARGGLWAVPERDEQYYRYSVKCDRATSQRIERAAREAGKSVTAFVQAHFDRILDAKPAADAARPFDAENFARENRVPLTAALMWHVLRQRAAGDGRVSLSQRQMAEAIGCDVSTPHRLTGALVEAGRLQILERSRGGVSPVYRVLA